VFRFTVPLNDTQPDREHDPISDEHKGENKCDSAGGKVSAKFVVRALGADISEDRGATYEDGKEELEEFRHVVEEHRPKFPVHSPTEAIVKTNGNETHKENIKMQHAHQREYRMGSYGCQY
jgi:hypothetical protein